MVAVLPVEQSVCLSGPGIEVVWAPRCHHAQVMLDERFGNAMGMERRNDRWVVVVCSGVVVTKEA